MKVQTSSLWHSSTLLLSPYTFSIWPVALCQLSSSASSLGWNLCCFFLAFLPLRVGRPCISLELGERNACSQVASQGCMSLSSSRLYSQPVITTSAIHHSVWISRDQRREEKKTPGLSVSISLLCSHGFLLCYKGNCQEELFTISCLKYECPTRADFCICWKGFCAFKVPCAVF